MAKGGPKKKAKPAVPAKKHKGGPGGGGFGGNTVTLGSTAPADPTTSPTIFEADVTYDPGASVVQGVMLFAPGDSSEQPMNFASSIFDAPTNTATDTYRYPIFGPTPGEWTATAVFAEKNPTLVSGTTPV